MLSGVGGGVSVGSRGLSVPPPWTCFAMPPINIVGVMGTTDNGTGLFLASLGMLLLSP